MSRHRECSWTEAVSAARVDPRGLSTEQREHVASCDVCAEASWLTDAMHKLAKEPIGRGSDAEVIWARAEVLRRLDSRPTPTPERSPAMAWGPLIGTVVAVASTLVLLAVLPSDGSGDGTLAFGVWSAVGSLVALALAVAASLALVWDEI